MITATSDALEAIRRLFAERGIKACLRVGLQSTGCCDASLGLFVDRVKADDLVENIGDVTLIVSPDVYQLTGDIVIDCRAAGFLPEFSVTSEKPLSEWAGFGACPIKF